MLLPPRHYRVDIVLNGVDENGYLVEVVQFGLATLKNVVRNADGSADVNFYYSRFSDSYTSAGTGDPWWSIAYDPLEPGLTYSDSLRPLPAPTTSPVLDLIAPATPTLALAYDSGVSETDRLTNDPTLSIGAEAGATELWTIDGQSALAYDPTALADGHHLVSLRLKDASGNLSQAASLDFTLDRTQPSLFVALSGGVNHLDHLVTGAIDVADAGLAITLTDNAGQSRTVVADAAGHFQTDWVFTPGEGGAISIVASTADAAGSVAAANAGMTLDFSANAPLFTRGLTNIDSLEGKIIQLYDGVLGRLPTDAELAAAKTQALAGASMTTLAGSLLGSAAFQQAYGATSASLSDAQLVADLYATGLGRQGSPAEIAAWANAIPSLGRAAVAAAIAMSGENRAQVSALLPTATLPGNAVDDIARLYYGLLDRAPDEGGLVYWNAVENNSTLSAVAAGILGSAEYLGANGAAETSLHFIQGLYESALGRTASNTEIDAWANALTQGATRADVAVGIADSAEARAYLAPRIESGYWLA